MTCNFDHAGPAASTVKAGIEMSQRRGRQSSAVTKRRICRTAPGDLSMTIKKDNILIRFLPIYRATGETARGNALLEHSMICLTLLII
jgi:hypothetical protein